MKRFLFLLSMISIGLGVFAQAPKKPVKKPAPKTVAPAATPKERHITVPRQYKDQTGKGTQRVEIETEFGRMVVRLYDETPLHRDNFIKLVKEGFYDSLLFHRVIQGFMIQGGDPQSKTADSAMMLGNGDVGYKIPAEFRPNLYHRRGVLAAARDNNPQQASSGCQFYIVQGRKFTAKELENAINSRNMSRKQEILYTLYQSDTVQAAVGKLQNEGDKEKVREYIGTLQQVADKLYKAKYPDAEKVDADQMRAYMEFGGAPHLDGSYTVFGELESGWDVLDKIGGTPVNPNTSRPFHNIRMNIRLL